MITLILVQWVLVTFYVALMFACEGKLHAEYVWLYFPLMPVLFFVAALFRGEL